MPFWGLVVTSLGFAIPAAIAFKKARWITSASCGVLTISSVAYHGTVHPLALRVDMFVAHSLGVGWAFESLRRTVIIRRAEDAIISAMTLSGITIYGLKSRNNFTESSRWWHMAFHVLAQSAWCIYLLR
jgi:hypothetical protein